MLQPAGRLAREDELPVNDAMRDNSRRSLFFDGGAGVSLKQANPELGCASLDLIATFFGRDFDEDNVIFDLCRCGFGFCRRHGDSAGTGADRSGMQCKISSCQNCWDAGRSEME